MKAKNNTYYLALSMNIQKKDDKVMRNELKRLFANTLQQQINKGSIKDTAIYSQKKAVEKHGEFTAWNYLALIELSSQEEANEVKVCLNSMKFTADVEVIRLELLITTPESTYPLPQRKAKKRLAKPFYAVEYVDVKKNYLKEFQNIMIKNNGPAMKYIMEHTKWCYNFYALETVHIYDHNPNYPTWNQIHVIGLFVESVFCYKKDFTSGLKEASGVSFDANFSRLREIRTMLYKTIGRKVM